MSRDPLDALGALPTVPPPPPGAALEAALAEIQPVPMRRPWRDLALVALASAVYGGALVAVLRLRGDAHELPLMWMIVTALAWGVGLVVPLYLAIVPRRGAVMPRWRVAGIAAAVFAVGFVIVGLSIHPDGPSSQHYGWARFHRGHICMEIGLVSALVPVGLGALVLRGALPVGARWAAAALGAAGGGLGGLVLHLHCPVADGIHLGLVHGGVVVVSALLAALIVPRAVDRMTST